MLYKNPTTLGKTPVIEAYKIGHCPTCDWPAVSVVDESVAVGPDESQRTIRCHCGRGHEWRTSWSGATRQIRRAPYDGRWERKT